MFHYRENQRLISWWRKQLPTSTISQLFVYSCWYDLVIVWFLDLASFFILSWKRVTSLTEPEALNLKPVFALFCSGWNKTFMSLDASEEHESYSSTDDPLNSDPEDENIKKLVRLCAKHMLCNHYKGNVSMNLLFCLWFFSKLDPFHCFVFFT